jgi:hypothetical protein
VPFIGYLQESSATHKLEATNPALYQSITEQKRYLLGDYHAIDPVKSATITDEASKQTIASATVTGQFNALGKMALFPGFMLVCYAGLILYFRSQGGYRPKEITGDSTSMPSPQRATAEVS